MSEIIRNRFFELSRYASSIGIVLSSGDDEYRGCRLRITGFGYWLSIKLPPVLPPAREKVFATTWDESTIARLGRNWYWHVHEREVGVSVNFGDHLCVYFGRQTHDSSTTRLWSRFLPWKQWDCVRWSGYGLRGEWLLDFAKDVREWSPQRDSLPKASFEFRDFDGQVIRADCHIEEREWHRGEGWFRWLRWFVKPMVRRSMDISFSAEVGPRKGSWKGGTVGTNFNLLDGELHARAFRRYCVEQKLEFIGPVSA